MEFLSFCILVSIIACAVIFCEQLTYCWRFTWEDLETLYVKNNPPWLAFPSSASQFLSSIFDAKANDLEAINVESTQHEPLRRGQKAVFSNTKLTDEEIFRMSVKIGEDWNKLAGLMNIPHDQQEEIRLNSSDYPSHSSKAEQILLLFNESKYFSRNALKKFFKKLGRNDLELEMLPVTNQCELRHECCQEQIECEVNDDYSRYYHQYVKVNPPPSLELWSYLRLMWVLILQNFHGQNPVFWNSQLPPNKEKIRKRKRVSRTSFGTILLHQSVSMFFRVMLTVMIIGAVRNNSSLQGNCVRETVRWNTKLTNEEITQMSHKLGRDWDKLGGLMNIPFHQREEIRFNSTKYLSFSSKARQVFLHFNESKSFSRFKLKKFLKELGRNDLEREMIPMENQSEKNKEDTSQNEGCTYVNIRNRTLQDDTPLSSREMCRFSREILEWIILASLMNIKRAEISDILENHRYYDKCSQAEKVLSIFNNREDFSRENLANMFEEIKQPDLKEPLITGMWRRA